MPSRWPKGEAEVDRALAAGEIERVPANRDHAGKLITAARTHLVASRAIRELDPSGAYQLAYDAARKSLTAILAVQGLRPRANGGHVVVEDLARAQFEPPLGPIVRPFRRMRRRRHSSEYPDESHQPIDTAEVDEVLDEVEEIINLADRMIPELGAF